MTRRARLASAAAGILLVSSLFAEQAVVTTQDGQIYQGDVQPHGGSVVVTSHGVETVIPQNDIASILPVTNYDDDFHARLGKLDSDDAAGRITLAHEAFEKGHDELARDALEEAMKIDPGNSDAQQMLATVQDQIRLEQNKVVIPPTTQPMVHVETTQAATQVRQLLTPADIQTIRRAELDLDDPGVRVRFDGDVKRQFALIQKIPFATFNALPAAQQAAAIFKDGDWTMREKVQVLSDPPAVMEFRRTIQPLVLQNCATTGCHGSAAGGKLILEQPVQSDAITYTNYYILQHYTQKSTLHGGVFESNEQRLIDRGDADKSLLPMYGLPAAPGQAAHPLVNGKPIAQIFHNTDDPRYQLLVQWINAMPSGDPNYGIHYIPATSTQPAMGN